MGRKTWESIPSKFRPLPGRTNIILTRDEAKSQQISSSASDPNSILVASSLKDATTKLSKMDNVGKVFVIGGSQVYEDAIQSGLLNRVIYTEVSNLPSNIKFDAWFPMLSEEQWHCQPFTSYEDTVGKESMSEEGADVAILHTNEKNGIQYRFLDYTRIENTKTIESDNKDSVDDAPINTEEMQYLDMCRDIIENGVLRGDRTGTGTLSKFGTQMKFSLRNGTLPLLTTKRTFWRGVAEELLWFIQVRLTRFFIKLPSYTSVYIEKCSFRYLLLNLHRVIQMQTIWLLRIFIFGMVMDLVSF